MAGMAKNKKKGPVRQGVSSFYWSLFPVLARNVKKTLLLNYKNSLINWWYGSAYRLIVSWALVAAQPSVLSG